MQRSMKIKLGFDQKTFTALTRLAQKTLALNDNVLFQLTTSAVTGGQTFIGPLKSLQIRLIPFQDGTTFSPVEISLCVHWCTEVNTLETSLNGNVDTKLRLLQDPKSPNGSYRHPDYSFRWRLYRATILETREGNQIITFTDTEEEIKRLILGPRAQEILTKILS